MVIVSIVSGVASVASVLVALWQMRRQNRGIKVSVLTRIRGMVEDVNRAKDLAKENQACFQVMFSVQSQLEGLFKDTEEMFGFGKDGRWWPFSKSGK